MASNAYSFCCGRAISYRSPRTELGRGFASLYSVVCTSFPSAPHWCQYWTRMCISCKIWLFFSHEMYKIVLAYHCTFLSLHGSSMGGFGTLWNFLISTILTLLLFSLHAQPSQERGICTHDGRAGQKLFLFCSFASWCRSIIAFISIILSLSKKRRIPFEKPSGGLLLQCSSKRWRKGKHHTSIY